MKNTPRPIIFGDSVPPTPGQVSPKFNFQRPSFAQDSGRGGKAGLFGLDYVSLLLFSCSALLVKEQLMRYKAGETSLADYVQLFTRALLSPCHRPRRNPRFALNNHASSAASAKSRYPILPISATPAATVPQDEEEKEQSEPDSFS